MVEITRGAIALCNLDPVMGTEQAGTRPCIVVQTDSANAVSPRTIIVPLTTQVRVELLRSHELLKPSQSGVIAESVVLCEQIRAIDRRRVVRVVGRLNADDIARIDAALRLVLEL